MARQPSGHETPPAAPPRTTRARGALTAVGVGSAGVGIAGSSVLDPAVLRVVGVLVPCLVGAVVLLVLLFVGGLGVAASRRIGADVVLHELLSWSVAVLGRERPWVFPPAVRRSPRAPTPTDGPPSRTPPCGPPEPG